MPDSEVYFESPGRRFELLFGIGLLAPAVFFGYYGITGAWAYFHGSRAAPADPLACGIGLGLAVSLIYLSARLISGRNSERPLLPNLVLLLAALGSLVGGVWFFVLLRDESINERMRIVEVFGTAGIVGLALLWHRLRLRT